MDRKPQPAPPFEPAPYDMTPNDPMSWSDYGQNMLRAFGTGTALNRGVASAFGANVPEMQQYTQQFAQDYPISAGAAQMLGYAPYALVPGGLAARAGVGGLMETGGAMMRNSIEGEGLKEGPESPGMASLEGMIAGAGGGKAVDAAKGAGGVVGRAAKSAYDYRKRPPMPKGASKQVMDKAKANYQKIEKGLDLGKYAGRGKREVQEMLKKEGFPVKGISKRADRIMRKANNP